MTKQETQRKMKWMKENTIRKEFRLSKVSDLDIIKFLEGQPKDFKFNPYIKALIRENIENQKRASN